MNLVSANLENKYVVGIDIGKTNVVSALVGYTGKVLAQDSRKIAADKSNDSIIKNIKENLKKVIAAAPDNKIEAIGIGCAGPLDFNAGKIVSWFGFPYWRDIPIKDIIAKEFGIKVFLDNDSNSAARGEGWIGAGSNTRNFVCLTLGTGVGGSIVIDNHVFRGINGMAGYAGHMVIVAGGLRCLCGNSGCLEAYVSATAIVERTKQAIKNGGKSMLSKMIDLNSDESELTALHVSQAAKSGDKLAGQIIKDTGYYLGIGIVNLVCLLDPEAIILTGGVSADGELILKPAEKELQKRLCLLNPNKLPSIKIGKLGNMSGAVGAAKLAWEEIDK
ncbi:MAG: ROK family protein [Actinobacteria bacterium]|nr:ROK family protein [Actinomycetota bacterium]